MNETEFGMWTQRFLTSLLLAVTAFAAHAFDRPFPPAAKRGTMTPAFYPAIVIDGKMRKLSAGAQIRNEKNLIEQPAYLRDTEFVVNYTESQDGDIDRVWILSKDEAGRSLSSQKNN